MDKFSRTLDPTNYNNAKKILTSLKQNGFKGDLPKVTTWELYDKAFTWPIVRRYETVDQGMDTIRHMQDNLNSNINNATHVDNFVNHVKEVRDSFANKFHNGEFVDPAK